MSLLFIWSYICFIPAGIYFFKVNNGNTRTMCEICSKLTKRHQDEVIYGETFYENS